MGGGGGEPSLDSPAIKPINKGAIHRICAGQVILDLSSAVKELVENSLDAGATSIEISLKDYGEESFQVIDNGCGISPTNFEVLALKHHTSKLTDFPDLQSLTTFGFRGEALSSLCALGDLTVETRTKSEQVATHLTFNHLGVLIAQKKTALQIGTTVTIKKLFSNLPVRSKEFHRNIRKEYGKLISLLNAYALVAKGVRLVCSNTTGRNAKSMVLNTQGSGSLKENIIAVFGMSTFTCLEPVSICISDACKVDGFLSKSGNGSGRNLGDRQYFFVNGRPVDMPKVSKLVNELYRGANSKQYPIAIMNFTVPTRACDVNVTPDKRKIFFSDEHSILQSLKEDLEKIYSPFQASYSVHKPEAISLKQNSPKLYSRHELGSQSPLQKLSPCVSDPDGASGNERCPVTNAKESIRPLPSTNMINNDRSVTSKRDLSLRAHGINKDDSFFGSQSELLTGDTGNATDRFGPPYSNERLKDTCGKIISPCSTNMLQSSLREFVTLNKRKHESISDTLSELPLLRNGSTSRQSMNEDSKLRNAFTRSPVGHNISDDSGRGLHQKEDSGEVDEYEAECSEGSLIEKHFVQSDVSLVSKVMNQLKSTGEDLEIIGKPTAADTSEITASPKNASEEVLDTPPILSTESKMCSTLQFSFDDLKARRQQRSTRLRDSNPTGRLLKIKRCYNAANLDLSQPVSQEGKERALAAATTELEKLFKKDDFGRMKVVGQFNLGFIIGKLDHDLFIVDQHAADEKYNFERLSQLTILNQQPLLRPLRMELSPQEEITVSMYMDIIRRNGFTLDEDVDVDAPPGQRFRLKAVPFSKNVTFGVADVKELISVLADSQGECLHIGSYKLDTPDSVCPPRVRAMLASRACRSSIMIGDPLGRTEMQKILEHLADLKLPWNCPHSRLTMRHLVDLRSLHKMLDDDDDDEDEDEAS